LNSRVSGGRPVAWEDAGGQIATLLGGYSAVVVTSSDPFAAAYVALGIAKAEAKHRRVVVGDLVGDLPPLRDLITETDPHGISDSFLYGVSLNKIGYAVRGTENLYIMPSGTDPDMGEEIFRSARWKKLATGFAEAGALLLLVTPSDSAGLGDLIDQIDGAVLVKDAEIPTATSSLILARVATPTPTLKIPLHRMEERAANWKQRVTTWKQRVTTWKQRATAWSQSRWFYPAVGALAILVIAGLGLALMLPRLGTSRSVARVPAATLPAPTPPPPRAPPETLQIAPPANVNDSASAATFGVELFTANTAEGANLFVRKNGGALPAAAVSPIPIDPERRIWYKVTAGAYTRRYQADSLLLALRNSTVLADSGGAVTRTPLALLVDSVPTQGGIVDAVRAAVEKYEARGLAFYALMQDDGGARIYAGAFARADQSAELIRTLRGAGLNPVLVYRTGSAP
jgi:cell division septation protein DedD